MNSEKWYSPHARLHHSKEHSMRGRLLRCCSTWVTCCQLHVRISMKCMNSRYWPCYALCYDLSFALLYADTSDCLLSSLPHPLTGLLYFYDLILLTQSHLVASRPVRSSSGVAIRSLMYDTHLWATHTTTSSIGGVQIPIYLVNNATDSL